MLGTLALAALTLATGSAGPTTETATTTPNPWLELCPAGRLPGHQFDVDWVDTIFHASLLGLGILLIVPACYLYARMATDISVVVVAQKQRAARPNAGARTRPPEDSIVLVASIEHDMALRELGPDVRPRAMAGGLGKVAGQLQLYHPTELISVHPEWRGATYCFEGGARSWEAVEPVCLRVDGQTQCVQVRRFVVDGAGRGPEASEPREPRVTYLVLLHAWFARRSSLYPQSSSSVESFRFFSLYNQAVGALIARLRPAVFQCPDFHAAVAPLYACRLLGEGCAPPKVVVVLHNAAYQGAASSTQLTAAGVRRIARLFDLPVPVTRRYLVCDGHFNMLQAAAEYVRRFQRGRGFCAVSDTYAEEAKLQHKLLWPLPRIRGLDNPMPETPGSRPVCICDAPLWVLKRDAKVRLKRQLEERFGYELHCSASTRLFVFLGRWVKQKGIDYIADIAEWMLRTFSDLQLLVAGPVEDAFGIYARASFDRLKRQERFQGRLVVHPGFMDLNEVPDLKLASDFCLMPSRDEPFGYVDIEFGWYGAVTVGTFTGGLSKLPGVYAVVENVESAASVTESLKAAVKRSMELQKVEVMAMAIEAMEYSFPVSQWQDKLLAIYQEVIDASPGAQLDRALFRWHRGESELVEANASVLLGGADEEFLRQEPTEQELAERMGEMVTPQPGRLFVLPESASEALAVCHRAFLVREEGRLTRWLAEDVCGIPRIDLVISTLYVLGPFLEAWCSMKPGDRDHRHLFGLTDFWFFAGDVAAAISIVVWVLLSVMVRPHVLMSVVCLLRLALLVLPSLHLPYEYGILVIALQVLNSSNYLFMFYSFMMSAVGDVSKLALRMGICAGLMYASATISTRIIEVTYSSTRRYVVGALYGLFMVAGMVLISYAPSPYRDFRLPGFSVMASVRYRRTPWFLAAAEIFGGSVAASLGQADALLACYGVPTSLVRAWEPYFMLATALAFSYAISCVPRHAPRLVKAIAFLLMPAALPQALILYMATPGDNSGGTCCAPTRAQLSAALMAAVVIAVCREICVCMAVLCTIEGRWRFVVFTTLTTSLKRLVSAAYKFLASAGFVPGYAEDGELEFRDKMVMVEVLAALALLQWLLQLGGIAFFDREMKATLTPGKKRSAHDLRMNAGSSLEGLVDSNVMSRADPQGSIAGLPAGSFPPRSLRPPPGRVDMRAHGGLRGLSAVWVVLFHILAGRLREMVAYGHGEWRFMVLDIQGCAIMPLFFVLSGFSLAVVYGKKRYRVEIYGDELDGERFAKLAFYKNRFARVMPGYYLSSLFAMPLLFLGFGPLDYRDSKSLWGTVITNIVPINTLLNCQMPPWPTKVKYDYGDPSTWNSSPILLKNINGPAWTIATLGCFWLAFPYMLPRLQRWSDRKLMLGFSVCYWLQAALLSALWLDFMVAEVGHLRYWSLAPGDVAFNAAALSPISRLPVFVMGVLAGLLCLRHVDDPGLPWPTAGKMLFPPFFEASVPRFERHLQLPVEEQMWGRYGQLWWARAVDRTSALLAAIFGVEILVDFYVLNFVHRDQAHPQGLGGAVWLQALVPYAFTCLAVGLTRDGGESRTASFFNHRWMQWLGNVGFSIYLVHFPLMAYLVWMQGSVPACFLGGETEEECNPPGTRLPQKIRPPFGRSNANWGANDPLTWWMSVLSVAGAIFFGWLLFNFFEEPMRKKLRA